MADDDKNREPTPQSPAEEEAAKKPQPYEKPVLIRYNPVKNVLGYAQE